MGSSQSNTATTPQSSSTLPSDSSVRGVPSPDPMTTTSSASTSAADEQQPESSLSGFDLVNYKCRRKEKAYKKCVSKYYSDTFLRGQSLDQEAACGDLFERYRRCYLRGVQKEVWGKDSPPPTKDSALARFAREEQEFKNEAAQQQPQEQQ